MSQVDIEAQRILPKEIIMMKPSYFLFFFILVLSLKMGLILFFIY